VTSDELRAASPSVVIQEGERWWRFAAPAWVVVARRPAEVVPAIRAIERAVEDDGYFAVGYLAYEAAAAYGLSVREAGDDSPPLLWFGFFRDRQAIDSPSSDGDYRFGEWRPSLDFPTYQAAIAHIKEAIAAGDTYQANFTFHLHADFAGDPSALFARLVGAQRANYCAYIDLGRFAICSASPELFFRRDGEQLTSRPMKGTAPRGLTTAEDRRQIDWLRGSEKNRAENVMIVDMIRNDFGRVAHVGSVDVRESFAVERYPTLLQMTSTVTAQTDASLAAVLAAVFPCASITGAPKVRTMRILTELETAPRGVYTGAIGCLAPGRRAQFNVAIRTAVIDRALGRATYGVGSGIVWDSDAAAEYDECLLKARVLDARRDEAVDFQLLESLLWTPAEGYFLLRRHLDRLAESAEYFGFACDQERVEQALAEGAAGLDEPSKVRLLLDRNGRVAVEAQALADGARPEPVRIGLARSPISTADVRLYHKTTRRAVYDAARASRPDCDDVILWNERGELTESSVANIVLELEGRRVTPPVSAGLLAGTFRAHLLEAGEIEECTLMVDDLARAGRVWLINSVRRWKKAVVVPGEE
jgi:para-aminobenzoate synthetase/4-amino-4-deoxychorismate lyase